MTINDIHLWFVFPEEITSASLLKKYHRLMSDDECTRMGRFLFRRNRHTFLISRAVMRTVLSHYTDVEPKTWCFRTNAYGKPEMESPRINIPPAFNLSHTDDLIVFAVTHGNDIGVDVETMNRRINDKESISRSFAPKEILDLQERPDQWKDRFFEYWTLKEAYIKAKGMGLSIPLDCFCFTMSGDSGLTIAFDPRMKDRPDQWQFWLMQPTAEHKAALTLNAPSSGKVNIEAYRIVPLQQAVPFDCQVLRSTVEK